MIKTDLVIIGAGPAGLAAADLLNDYELDIVIVDEQPRPGGQIYRQPPENFRVSNWLSSRLYDGGKRLLKRVSQFERIQWFTQSTVLGITQNINAAPTHPHKVTICRQTGTLNVEAKYLLIAPGCFDMPVVFPGWNLPGVMAAGGIQAFVKSQQIIPGENILFVGTHPLQLIVADQIVQAGGNVSGVIFAQRFSRVFELLRSPHVLIKHIGKFLQIAGALFRLRKACVPVRFGETVIEARGEEVLDSAVVASVDSAGNVQTAKTRTIECDRLGICFSFLASSELARQCGAECSWSSHGGGWIVNHDEWMRTSVPRIYVAGEITGVAGADVAEQEGRLAGLGIARDLRKVGEGDAERLSAAIRSRLDDLNQFADTLKRLSFPGRQLLFQLMSDKVTLCKCEDITVAEFKSCLTDNPTAASPNAVKLLARTGMGLCQGRYCNYMLTRLLAERLDTSEQYFQPFTARFPAKPVRISSLLKGNRVV